MRKLIWFGGAVLWSCAGGDAQQPDPACDPVGTWVLVTTFDAGDCAELGDMVADTVRLSDAGDVFRAELLLEGGSAIECVGEVTPACAAQIECVAQLQASGATSQATARFDVLFERDSVSGSSSLAVTGDANCSSTGPVTGSR